MERLSPEASAMIQQWAEKLKMPTIGVSLIESAQTSPYLASQFNELQSRNGALLVGQSGEGTSARGTIITIDPKMVGDYFGRNTELGRRQLATVFAHELGHALSPGGTLQQAATPEDEVRNSHRAEGVALSSELIVASQLGLGGVGSDGNPGVSEFLCKRDFV